MSSRRTGAPDGSATVARKLTTPRIARLRAESTRRARLDQPVAPRGGLPRPHYDPEAFGRFSEAIARYLGTAHFQRLLREPPSSLISSVVDTDIDPLGADCPLAEVTRHLASYNLVAVPIVDSEQRLIGAVTVDDVLDHLLPADWRETRGVRHG